MYPLPTTNPSSSSLTNRHPEKPNFDLDQPITTSPTPNLTANNSMRSRRSTQLFFLAVVGVGLWYFQFGGGKSLALPQRFSPSFPGAGGVDSWQQEGAKLHVPFEQSLGTVYVDGVPGYSLFRNLYLHNGTFYAISPSHLHPNPSSNPLTSPPSDPKQKRIPPVENILSDTPDNVTGKRLPAKEERWRVINEEEGREIFGGRVAVRVGGTTLFFNDEESGPPRNVSSFLNHYFHLAEAFAGAWRLLAKVHAEETGSNSVKGISFPARIIVGFVEPKQWRDHAGLSTWFLQTLLPMTAIEEATVWTDRAKSGTLQVFDQIVLLDRFSSSRSSPTAKIWNKMAAELPNIPAPKDWWTPIRANLFYAIGSPELLAPRGKGVKPVVTYVSRQSAKHRRMFPADNEEVVKSLQALHDSGKIEFVHALMEKMDRAVQFRLAARTDILVGIHGNGLSHQMWQRPGSDVVEIMDAGGFTRDYEILAEIMDHEHYTVHNDVLFTRDQWFLDEKKSKPVGQTKDFHGDNIRCNGAFVAKVVTSIVDRKYQ